ncbi:hypothetical protein [Aliihoeflea sp. 2WW]|uniref:hypothetical protein n=1 Tax=Aliihoeflea sp. 2WW TaxID=1381123 RepID=UPI0004633EDE|nr:hypothetical protein [Aliihoeflea sp. 2WW]
MPYLMMSRMFLLTSALAAAVFVSAGGAAVAQHSMQNEIRLREEASQIRLDLDHARQRHQRYDHIIREFLAGRVTREEMNYTRELQRRNAADMARYESRQQELQRAFQLYDSQRKHQNEESRKRAVHEHYNRQDTFSRRVRQDAYQAERSVRDGMGWVANKWDEVKGIKDSISLDRIFDENDSGGTAPENYYPNTFFFPPEQESFEGSAAERRVQRAQPPKYEKAKQISAYQQRWAEEDALLRRLNNRAPQGAGGGYQQGFQQIDPGAAYRYETGISGGRGDSLETGIVNPLGENPYVPAQPVDRGTWEEPRPGQRPGWQEVMPREGPRPGWQEVRGDPDYDPPQQFGRAYSDDGGAGAGIDRADLQRQPAMGGQLYQDISRGSDPSSGSGQTYGTAYGDNTAGGAAPDAYGQARSVPGADPYGQARQTAHGGATIHDPYHRHLTLSDPVDPYPTEPDDLGGVSADVRPNIVTGPGMSSLRDSILTMTAK